jgi:hypothetical protein
MDDKDIDIVFEKLHNDAHTMLDFLDEIIALFKHGLVDFKRLAGNDPKASQDLANSLIEDINCLQAHIDETIHKVCGAYKISTGKTPPVHAEKISEQEALFIFVKSLDHCLNSLADRLARERASPPKQPERKSETDIIH